MAHCFSMFTIYIVIHFRPGSQEVNTNLNNLIRWISFDELLSETDNVLQKEVFN